MTIEQQQAELREWLASEMMVDCRDCRNEAAGCVPDQGSCVEQYRFADAILAGLTERGAVLKAVADFPDSYLSLEAIENLTAKMADYGGGDADRNVAHAQRLHTEYEIRAAGFTTVAPLQP